MLTRPAVGALTIAAGLLTSLLAATPALGADPVTCDGYYDGRICWVTANRPGSGSAAAGSGGSASIGAKRVCMYAGEPTPCVSSVGWWSDAKSCYVQLAPTQPPADDPAWEGHSDGAIYLCSLPGSGTYRSFPFWAATAPAGPDPLVLAERAIDSMNLTPISIGIVPEDAPGAVGLVGLPTWLWVENPGPQSWGPITRSASSGGVTVTATARVQRVRWLMGDGGVVTCTGPGTRYEDRFGTNESPTCGYRYRAEGTYRVRAESSWVVSWSGMGRSGTIPVTTTASTSVTIGELHVLTQGRG